MYNKKLMNRHIIALFIVCIAALSATSCKVKRAPGAYKVVEAPTQDGVKQALREETFKADEANDEDRLSTYNVVIGSFTQKQNAIKLKNEQSDEYNPIIVINEKGMFRVILISYRTYNEAKAKISEISDKFADAWVLVQKK